MREFRRRQARLLARRRRALVGSATVAAGVFALATPGAQAGTPTVVSEAQAQQMGINDQYPMTAQEKAGAHVSIIGGDPGEQVTGTVTIPPDKCGVKDPEAAKLLCTYSFGHRNNPQPAAGASIARKRKLLKLSAKAAQTINGGNAVVVPMNGATVSDLTVKAAGAATTRAISPVHHPEMWDYILYQAGPFQLYLQTFNLAWYDWDYAWMDRQRRGVVGYHRCQSGPNFGYDVSEAHCNNVEGAPGWDAWVDGQWNVSVLNKNISNSVQRWIHDHTYGNGVQRWVQG